MVLDSCRRGDYTSGMEDGRQEGTKMAETNRTHRPMFGPRTRKQDRQDEKNAWFDKRARTIARFSGVLIDAIEDTWDDRWDMGNHDPKFADVLQSARAHVESKGRGN